MVVFCTNIWNHHQGPVAVELARQTCGDFKMLLHQPLDHIYSKERQMLGWNIVPPSEDWIVGPPKATNLCDYSAYVKFAMDADVLLLDGIPPYLDFRMLRSRYKQGKVTFVMGERFFKEKRPWYFCLSLRKLVGRLITWYRYESAHIHFLTMSHWCLEDLSYYGICKGRTWRWGYLTEVSSACTQKDHGEKLRVGWCGRMIDWKRPDLVVLAVSKLAPVVREKIEVVMVGDGPERSKVDRLVEMMGLKSVVSVVGSKTACEIRAFMKSCDVFVFTSNRKEGWGAVLPEAMDSACAVIASKAAGSTLELVKDGYNGFVFEDGNDSELASLIHKLVDDRRLIKTLGRRAWEDMQEWSPREGASRLLELAKRLCGDSSYASQIKKGVCERVG